jgi:hypothetical protein
VSSHTCPECGRGFAILAEAAAPTTRTLVQCPHLDAAGQCSGMVEADVPHSAIAVASEQAGVLAEATLDLLTLLYRELRRLEGQDWRTLDVRIRREPDGRLVLVRKAIDLGGEPD